MFVEAAAACSKVAKKTNAKVWWQPAALTILGAIATMATVKANAMLEGRDERDEDIVRIQKTLDEQHEAIIKLRERQSWLSGRIGGRSSTHLSTPTAVEEPPELPLIVSQHNIPVSPEEVREYQNEKDREK